MPKIDYDRIQLAHGSGGLMMQRLIEQIFRSTFASKDEKHRHDAAVIDITAKRVAFTTDSYVVDPLFFPGGDIGTLAVNGTINDLAMAGAVAIAMSLSFIIEEGFLVSDLWKISCSIASAAQKANVSIVTGDTKVVDKGKGDGIFINSSGIGIVSSDKEILPSRIQEGDAIIVNGDIGRHGMAIMAVREGLNFESCIESDCAPLSFAVQKLITEGIDIHCLRDLTRGGLASALNEIADQAGLRIIINESDIPVQSEVSSACEILGLDPLYVANEGKFIAFIPQDQVDKALSIMKNFPDSQKASFVGVVERGSLPEVLLKSPLGSSRIITMLSGDQLPRIC